MQIGDSGIQAIKERFGASAEAIIAHGLNLEKRNKMYRCPNTYAHKRGDRTPSMGWDPKAHQFHCFGCGMLIDIYSYYRDHLNYTHREIMAEFNGEIEYGKTQMDVKRNEFAEETRRIVPITDECIAYIQKRGLTKETVEYFGLKSFDGMIAFPYYRFDTVVGYKTRKPLKDPGKPKMLSVKGSKPYLFNAQNVPVGEELIICEGEFDCMCIHQSGYPNVVSVGAGANSMSTLLEQADEYIRKFKHLIIVSDNDEAGANMDKAFVEKYGDAAKLIDKAMYKHKDANEELVLRGPDAVKGIVESARFKMRGRRDLDKEPYKGLSNREGRYIPTGIDAIDNAINDLMPGCVTLLTGRSNGGKTTFTKQIIANAIGKGNKVYVVSGEGDQEIFVNEIYKCVVGRRDELYDTVRVNRKYHCEPKPDVLAALKTWHKGKLVLFDKTVSDVRDTNQLFQMLEYEVKMNRFNLVIIDNLMSVLSAKAVEKNEAQAEFMQRLHDLAIAYRTHIILVVHPNKEYRKGQEMDFEMISGTSDLPNKADNVIVVIREYSREKLEAGVNGKIAVLKNRYYSDLASCDLKFDTKTGQLLEIQEDGRAEANGFGFKYDDWRTTPW